MTEYSMPGRRTRTRTRRECSLPGCDGAVFYGKKAYEQHKQDHNTQPLLGQFKCQTCDWTFDDSLALESHQRLSGHVPHECDQCQQVFRTATLLSQHKQFPAPCSDAFGKPDPLLRESTSPQPQPQPQQVSSLSHSIEPILPALQPRPVNPPNQAPAVQVPPPSEIVAPIRPIAVRSATRVCGIGGCEMFFTTDAGLKVHKQDRHGLGGKALDVDGRDSWMLSSFARQQLKNAGVLRSAGGPSTPLRGPLPFRPAMNRVPPPPTLTPMAGASRSTRQNPQITPASPPQAAPVASVAGLDEMNQARQICDKIMRLVLQSDVFIYHTGKMTCSGIDWTRIPSARQGVVVTGFSDLCHLAPKFKTEFAPAPITYKDEYMSAYPAAEYKVSPETSGSHNALPVIAISCSKVVLSDGLLESVKIAAVDVVSGRILMSHLICTDPSDPVKLWNSTTTGLSGYHDIENARQDGYKVLRGWTAARSALWEFIDRDTILVGWNIRADLDSLRMIHGRAVDIAKIFEKAAGGPLSKLQVSLESLCRDLPGLKLTNHAIYGRDSLQNAFATREIGLWILKNKNELKKIAEQKALDYSRLA